MSLRCIIRASPLAFQNGLASDINGHVIKMPFNHLQGLQQMKDLASLKVGPTSHFSNFLFYLIRHHPYFYI